MLQQVNIVYLLLGSNLGNRRQFLYEAMQRIAEEIGRIVQQSSVYETQAWGNTAVPDYLNQVLEIETESAPHQLLRQVLAIEEKAGRRREEKWGSRTIDIDILFYNHQVINTPDLIIPHPLIQERRFVLEPLTEIVPELLHPVIMKTMKTLKQELNDSLTVKKL